MDAAERSSVELVDQVYDGFISYSHAADGLLAPRLQSALQRFAKPWWKRRAVRIFRDESSLSANPHLWSSITDALDTSGWFVLLLSPDAALSEWVNQEIAYWVENRDPKKILPVVTDGDFGWSHGEVTGGAVPDALRGVFDEEPRWVDLRFANDEEQLDLNNPTFSAAVADVASAIRGVPKDELESEEVRQHRRTVRTAWAAGGLVTVLAVAAVGFGLEASRNADEAERQAQVAAEQAQLAETNAEQAAENAAEADSERLAAERAEALAVSRELAASAVASLGEDPELAILLALEAIDATPEGAEPPLEVVNALWRAGSANRLVGVIETGSESYIDLSDDGRRLVATSGDASIRMVDISTGALLWEYAEVTVDRFKFPAIGPDGRVAFTAEESPSETLGPGESDDGLPNRLIVLDGEDGTLLETIEYPDCLTVESPTWSTDGRFLAVGSGFEFCDRQGSPSWIEVFDTETWEAVALLPEEDPEGVYQLPRFDDSGRLYSLAAFGTLDVYAPETFQKLATSDANGIGDVTPDGTKAVLFYSAEDPRTGLTAFTFDIDSGSVMDTLYLEPSYIGVPQGLEVTDDGRYVVIGTTGGSTFVYDLGGEERFRLPTGSVQSTAYDPASERLYTAGVRGDVWVWDLSESAVGVERTGDLGRFTWVDGNSFVVGPEYGFMATFDLAEGGLAGRIFDTATGDLLDPPLTDVDDDARVMADGRFVIRRQLTNESAGWFYDPTADEFQEILPCQEYISEESRCADPGAPAWWDLIPSVDGTELMALAIDDSNWPTGEVLRLDPNSGDVIAREDVGPYYPAAVFYGADWLFGQVRTGDGAPRGVIIDRESGEVRWEGTGDNSGEVSLDGKLLALKDGGTELVVVDTATGREVLRSPGADRIRGLAFSADGSRIAIGRVGSVSIIDLETGLVAQQIRLAGVSDAHWLDDETLLIGTNSGIFGKLSLSTDEFLQASRDSLRRSFTDVECSRYRIDPCPTLEELRGG